MCCEIANTLDGINDVLSGLFRILARTVNPSNASHERRPISRVASF